MRLFLSILLAGCATTPETQQFNELTFLANPAETNQEAEVLENKPELEEAEEPSEVVSEPVSCQSGRFQAVAA